MQVALDSREVSALRRAITGLSKRLPELVVADEDQAQMHNKLEVATRVADGATVESVDDLQTTLDVVNTAKELFRDRDIFWLWATLYFTPADAERLKA